VESDLEQMPHLLNFLTNNGTVLNKHYTTCMSVCDTRRPPRARQVTRHAV
jgi:hypothetical protein